MYIRPTWVHRIFSSGSLAPFVCFLVGLSLLLSFPATIAHAATGQSLCVGTTHCYGIATWSATGATSSFAGAATSISTVPLSTQNYGLHVFTHELWLGETSARCNANLNHLCWVEAGYGNMRGWYDGGFYVGMFYFWADSKPGETAVHVHILGPVTFFGQTQDYRIFRINSTTYEVVAGRYVAYSTQNVMGANSITVGEELANDAGVSSTSAPQAYFTHISWLDPAGWHAFQTPGQVSVARPLLATWTSPQTFYSACCGAGI